MNQLQTDKGAEGNPLPTAQEIAMEKSKLDLTPTTSGFWHRLRNGIRFPHGEQNPALDEGGKAIPVNTRTVEAILFDSMVSVFEEGELDRLASIEAKMLATLARLADYSSAKVNDYLNAQRDSAAAALTSGGDLSSDVLPTRDTVAADFRVKQGALNSLLLKTTHNEVVPLCKPILQRFEGAVEKVMREQEEHDRGVCEAFSLEYRPSYVWRAAASVAIQYQTSRRLPQSHAWTLPSSLLDGIHFNK